MSHLLKTHANTRIPFFVNLFLPRLTSRHRCYRKRKTLSPKLLGSSSRWSLNLLHLNGSAWRLESSLEFLLYFPEMPGSSSSCCFPSNCFVTPVELPDSLGRVTTGRASMLLDVIRRPTTSPTQSVGLVVSLSERRCSFSLETNQDKHKLTLYSTTSFMYLPFWMCLNPTPKPILNQDQWKKTDPTAKHEMNEADEKEGRGNRLQGSFMQFYPLLFTSLELLVFLLLLVWHFLLFFSVYSWSAVQ